VALSKAAKQTRTNGMAAVIEGTLARKALVTKVKFYRLEDGFLDFFPNEQALKLSGRIFLDRNCKLSVSGEESFTLVSREESHKFNAPSRQIRDLWVEALQPQLGQPIRSILEGNFIKHPDFERFDPATWQQKTFRVEGFHLSWSKPGNHTPEGKVLLHGGTVTLVPVEQAYLPKNVTECVALYVSSPRAAQRIVFAGSRHVLEKFAQELQAHITALPSLPNTITYGIRANTALPVAGANASPATVTGSLQGCTHFNRNCMVWSAELNRAFWCHLCCLAETGQALTVAAMVCVRCNLRQVPAQKCGSCDLQMAPYFCPPASFGLTSQPSIVPLVPSASPGGTRITAVQAPQLPAASQPSLPVPRPRTIRGEVLPSGPQKAKRTRNPAGPNGAAR
jgi:hypothetical protein